MNVKLHVLNAEQRQWVSAQKGAQDSVRLRCIDPDGKLEHFVTVELSVEATKTNDVQKGKEINFSVTKIQQWKDGTVFLRGDLVQNGAPAKSPQSKPA